MSDSKEESGRQVPSAKSDSSPASKKLKAELHEGSEYVAPHSFLKEAFEKGHETNYFDGDTFGVRHEAYIRDAYRGIFELIANAWEKNVREGKKRTLAIVRGSTGVGKSVFLGYAIAKYVRGNLKHVALFYATKESKSRTGEVNTNEVRCTIWLHGNIVTDDEYFAVRTEVKEHLSELQMIVMDGCSMPFSLSPDFKGLILVSASPSLYIKNLKDAIFNHYEYTMPPASIEEARRMGEIVGADVDVVTENFRYMNGITRYLLQRDSAKHKVDNAMLSVSAQNIFLMVSMQSTSKLEDQVAVHSLVLWKVNQNKYEARPTFELVSRYAEQLIAKKLALEATATLRNARLALTPLSGAEGFAGALFEAYAIRTLRGGGSFYFRNLEGESEDPSQLSLIKMKDYIEIESNSLSEEPVNFARVRPTEGTPRLLWPTTTNIPTFDCFYFHQDGTVYPMQMTIAKTHLLKNSGAKNTKDYFDKYCEYCGDDKPMTYKAVFVVPEDMAKVYTKQEFVGLVKNKIIDMTPHFEQWVIGIPEN